MQTAIVYAALEQLVAITMPGAIVLLPYTYVPHG
jgi:hypothetical protein